MPLALVLVCIHLLVDIVRYEEPLIPKNRQLGALLTLDFLKYYRYKYLHRSEKVTIPLLLPCGRLLADLIVNH